jgi:hypothetical protein
MLVSRVMEKMYENGKEVKKWRIQPDGSGGFPVRFDPETKETLGDMVTREIVGKFPYVNLLMPDTFGKYVEDDEDIDYDAQAGDPTTETSVSSSPAQPLRKAEGAA